MNTGVIISGEFEVLDYNHLTLICCLLLLGRKGREGVAANRERWRESERQRRRERKEKEAVERRKRRKNGENCGEQRRAKEKSDKKRKRERSKNRERPEHGMKINSCLERDSSLMS